MPTDYASKDHTHTNYATKEDLNNVSVSESQIEEVIENYLEENPIEGGGAGVDVTYDEVQEALIFGPASGESGGSSSEEGYELITTVEITEDDVTKIELDLNGKYKEIMFSTFDVTNKTIGFGGSDLSRQVTSNGNVKIRGYDKNVRSDSIIYGNTGVTLSAYRIITFGLKYINKLWYGYTLVQLSSGGVHPGDYQYGIFSEQYGGSDHLTSIMLEGAFMNGCKLYVFGIKREEK